MLEPVPQRELPGLEPGGIGLRPGPLEDFYRDVEDLGPFVDPRGFVVVTSQDDIRHVLGHPSEFINTDSTLFPHFDLSQEAVEVIIGMGPIPGVTAGGDGEVHERGIKAVRATFATSHAKVEAQYSGLVQGEVSRLIDTFPEHARPLSTTAALGMTATGRQWREVDLIRNFAWELPLTVICKILGFPPDQYPDIKKWSEGQIALVWGQGLTHEQEVEAAQGLANLWQLCQDTIALRRQEPQDDMASRLVAYTDKMYGHLDPEEFAEREREAAAILLNMAVAGHETTANAIGNGLNYLLSNPELWRQIVDNPSSIPDVAEELLRLHPPIVAWSRRAARDTDISGVPVLKDQRVIMAFGAGNRDADTFPNPHQFIAGREGIKSDTLTFGDGIHYCVGAPLARMEMTEALRWLAAAHPELALRPGFSEDTAEYQRNIAFRALRLLPGIIQVTVPGGEPAQTGATWG